MLGTVLVIVYSVLFLIGAYAIFRDIEDERRQYLSEE